MLANRTERGLRIQELNAGQIAREIEGFLEGDAAILVNGVAPVRVALQSDLTFWTKESFTGEAHTCGAGVMLAPFGVLDRSNGMPPGVKAVIQVADPYQSLCELLKKYHEPFLEASEAKISWDAVVHPTAMVEGVVWPGVQIGPNCVVMAGSDIGWNTVLEANVTVYGGVVIGRDCVVQAGVVLGSRGFGYRPKSSEVDAAAPLTAGVNLVAVPHYAGVEIGDRVHIGAQSVVAAGFIEPTRLGHDCKLDSFVQIAHNCQVGKGVVMSSGAGLAGSVIVGDYAEFGGAAQVAGHIKIGSKARIAAKSGVTKSVADGDVVAGFPAEPIAKWRRMMIYLRQKAE